MQVHVELAATYGGARLATAGGRPGAGVADDHIAAGVLTGRDGALEVEVLHRVVLDVYRQPSDAGSSAGPFGTAQATSTSSISSAEVVVQPPGRGVAGPRTGSRPTRAVHPPARTCE